MAKDAVQRTTVKGSDGTRRASAIKKLQLNIRVSHDTLVKLRKLSKASGKSQSWIVEHAISQSLEFND